VSNGDRRTRRREATVEGILDRAILIMADVGVAGLTMTRLARAMGIQPPSLYKYFPSVIQVHDALFLRGQQANLDALRRGMAAAPAGLPALVAGMTETAHWAVANPVLAQLLFWRPVPGFQPSAAAFAPAEQLVALLRENLRVTVAAGQLSPGADSEEALGVLASLHFGVLSQHLANDAGQSWQSGRYTRLYPRVIGLFADAYRAEAVG
jgi:AcrR family transcriptional regulator